MKDFNFIVVNVLQYIHVSNYTVHMKCAHVQLHVHMKLI